MITIWKEDNAMQPLYTLLLCLPSALALIACAYGLAVLRPPVAWPAEHPTDGRRRGKKSAGCGTEDVQTLLA
jgi:hypothetical protein